MRVLITGGAGFIGLKLAQKCLDAGCKVTLFDNLSPQIHGSSTPAIPLGAELVVGDVCDKAALRRALADQDCVVHFAAETGTGQSMYEISHYGQSNLVGTSHLFDILVNDRSLSVRKVVTASSRAIYGEGAYFCKVHGGVFPSARLAQDMEAGQFEPRCPICSDIVQMRPTLESSRIHPTSFYGITKQVQEQMTLLFAESMGIDGFALRFQNVYGPGQSLKNPYTGILAIFSNLARANKPINIFEDGQESRDFVYVDDAVDATWACLQPQAKGVHALNVGGGASISVLAVAKLIVQYFASHSEIRTSGQFRIGDIRHNLADNSLAAAVLGYAPKVGFDVGIKAFLDWARQQETSDGSAYERSLAEMRDRALMR